MPRGGLKIVSETNLGRVVGTGGGVTMDKYKEVLVCLDTPSNEDIGGHNSYILTDTTNRTTMRELTVATSQRTFINLDNKNWQGGVTTVLTPMGGCGGDVADAAVFLPELSAVNSAILPDVAVAGEATTSAVKSRGGGGGRRPTIKVEEELSPEEEERRRIRRERNKQAAARCRKRRVDQTVSLETEVEGWEERNRQLQEEILNLKTQEMELHLVLEAHLPVCCQRQAGRGQPTARNNGLVTVTDKGADEPLAKLPRVVVKSEPPLMASEFTSLGDGLSSIVTLSTATTTSRHLTHEEALQNLPPPASATCTIAGAATTTTVDFVTRRPQRPASLSFLATKSSASNNANMGRFSDATAAAVTKSIEGVPIETPTSVVASLNFDALMDGRTGLTPTNILTPVSLSFCTSLNTPIVQSTPTPSSSSGCSSQQRGHHHLGELLMGSPDTGLMKLVSL